MGQGSSITKRSDYLSAIHYEDADGDGTTTSLEITFIQHEEGRYRPNGSEMIYEYNLTDHLGNTRITFGDADADGLADILQENHYYPFGMAMTMSSTLAAAPPNNYLYNGKELQDELDLGWYDYGARMYDASIGRWNGVDALGEKYADWSPYNYVLGNPIRFIDLDGNRVDDHYVDIDGNVRTIATNYDFDRFYVHDDESASGYSLVAVLHVNDEGLVNFPNTGTGFTRYGTNDAGGTSTNPAEVVGQGDHYLKPETAAALFGLTSFLNDEHGFSISLGDMSSSNGSDPWQLGFPHHAGHGHLGNRTGLDVDFRYLNSDGETFQSTNAFGQTQYSEENNQAVYDAAQARGFTINYQGTNGNLTGATQDALHNDHGHLGLDPADLNWSYVRTPPNSGQIMNFIFNQ